MELSPATSTIEGIMTMSLVPTYCDTLPEAMVDTMTFGTPIGKARMPGVASDVPPLPPKRDDAVELPFGVKSSVPVFQHLEPQLQ
jgi:hypothetical protein